MRLQRQAPRLEVIRAEMSFSPSWMDDVQIGPCADAKVAEALLAAYGDSRCISPVGATSGSWIDNSDCSWDLSLYLAEQFERNLLGISTPSDLGTEILGQRDFVGDRAVLWEEVVSLTFDFENEDRNAIRRFYRKWGSLGYPRGQRPVVTDAEPWGWCLAALRWFQRATSLFTLIKEQRAGALRELFGEPRQIDVYGPETSDAIFPRRFPFRDQRDYVWRYDTPDVLVRDGAQFWATPKNDSDLYRVALSLLEKAVSLELQKIPLVPQSPRSGDRSSPIAWGFYPVGCFHAALLQWFFQTLAGMETQTCAAKNCDNPVQPPQKKYCSPQCEMRTRKANDRARHAMAIRLRGEGLCLAEIGLKIQEYFGMRRRPTDETIQRWIEAGSRGRGSNGR